MGNDGWKTMSHATDVNHIAGRSAKRGGVPSEVLFIDPSISDIETILDNLRPEVEAIVLDTVRPAARQIALALAKRQLVRMPNPNCRGTVGERPGPPASSAK
jgi:hypothetical protein